MHARKSGSSKTAERTSPSAANSSQSAAPFAPFLTPTHTEEMPLRKSPQRTARAAPPAPSTTARLPAGTTPCSANPARNPTTSVLCPIRVPSVCTTTVFTARIRRASSLSASISSMISVLNGIVTLNPTTPASRSPYTAEESAPGRTGSAA